MLFIQHLVWNNAKCKRQKKSRFTGISCNELEKRENKTMSEVLWHWTINDNTASTKKTSLDYMSDWVEQKW